MVFVKAETGPSLAGDPAGMFTVRYYDEDGNLTIRSRGKRAWRCNNPGNLVKSPYSISKKRRAIGFAGDGKDEYAVYPDYETGHEALVVMLRGNIYSPLTLREASIRFVPSDPDHIHKILKLTKLDPERTIKSLSEKEFKSYWQAIEYNEGWEEGQEDFIEKWYIAGVHKKWGIITEYLIAMKKRNLVTKMDAMKLAVEGRLHAVIVHLKMVPIISDLNINKNLLKPSLKSYVATAYFCFLFLFGTVESAELSGRLVKKYYNAPSIVKNPAFGWFIELDTASKDYIQSLYRQLDAENARVYSDFALNIVQLTALGCEELEQCHVLEGQQISVTGKVENPPHIFRAIRCYQLDRIDRLCALSPVQAPSTLPAHNACAFLIVGEGHGKTLVTPESYGIDVHNLSDIPLEYEDGHPEELISLRGKLILRLYPGPPEYNSVENGDYPGYCWFLQMDRPSFQIAFKTLLPGLALSPEDIMSHINWYEVQLGCLSPDDFYCQHVNQEVVVEGYLFHAHTAHHHAPFLLDMSSITACKTERSMEEHPKYLYKILSLDDWKKSGDIIHLPPADSEFIHFSTDVQLPKIIEKYWSDVSEFIVLKVDTQKLSGTLVFEANPGGTTKYYHLYQGCIPRDAIVEATTVTH